MPKIMFLGTGAADRMALGQDSDFNNKDHRRCACALLDDTVLLDCGPHTLNALMVAGINLSQISNIVVTHLHSDHFNLDAINTIAKHNPNLHVFVRFDAVINGKCDAEIVPMQLFKKYDINGFEFTAVPANHSEFPQHFVIKKGGKSLLYALDGAWMLNEAIEFLKRESYDSIVLDATVGDYSGDYRIGEHNSIPMIRLMTDSMKTLNIIGENSRVILSHIACCLHKPHTEIEKAVAADGYIVAYDGLTLDF